MVRAALATSRSFNVPTFQQGVATPHRGMSLRCAAACTTHVSIDIGPSLPECGLPFRSRFHSFRVRDQRRRRIKKHGTDGRPRRPRRRPKQRADAWEADGDFHKQHPHDVRRDAEREGGREGGTTSAWDARVSGRARAQDLDATSSLPPTRPRRVRATRGVSEDTARRGRIQTCQGAETSQDIRAARRPSAR